MLRQMRRWGRAFLYLDLMSTAAWYIAAAVIGTLLLVVAFARGQDDQIFPLLVAVLWAVAVLGFFGWVFRDARAARKELRRQRHKPKARPDGDLTDVAGTPQRPPWMG